MVFRPVIRNHISELQQVLDLKKQTQTYLEHFPFSSSQTPRQTQESVETCHHMPDRRYLVWGLYLALKNKRDGGGGGKIKRKEKKI